MTEQQLLYAGLLF